MMRPFLKLACFWTRFGADRRGNFAVMMGVVAALLALSAGFAVNTAELVITRANLLNALDAAVTSTARDLTTGRIVEQDARDVVTAFLTANGGTAFAKTDKITLDDLVVDRTKGTVTAKASVMVRLAFPLFNIDPVQRVSTESAAVYSDKAIEVSMMLDITGSMAGQKLKDLKQAASDTVDSFLKGQDPDNPRVRIAIIPYADAVNTGPLADTVYVEKAFSAGDPPGLADAKTVSARQRPDNCATERKGSLEFTDAGPYSAMINRDYRLDFCPSPALHPLTADADALKSTISSFSAGGHTAGQIGIQWAWYMLSHNWASVLPKAERPAQKNAGKVAKIAVLMTDGEFNTAFDDIGLHGNPHNQAVRSSNDAERLCSAMKKDGIEIFTIGFMLNEATAKSTLKSCASADGHGVTHYYEAADGASLHQAFLDVAQDIQRLALTR